jgi:hypothetical protein
MVVRLGRDLLQRRQRRHRNCSPGFAPGRAWHFCVTSEYHSRYCCGYGQQSAIQIGLRNTASAAVGAGPSFLFFADNSVGQKQYLGRLSAVWENPTYGSEAGAVILSTRANSGNVYADTERLRITSGGRVGIGTSNPQYLLSVSGTIGAKDVIVTNTGWSDYVFRSGYRLRPLSEVNAYIQRHHHLPEIPSEREVRENGVSVGEMQARLLAKIEELTLHLIQQEKANQELRERVSRLEKAAPVGVSPAQPRSR